MNKMGNIQHSTFNSQRPIGRAVQGKLRWKLNVECWALDIFPFPPEVAHE